MPFLANGKYQLGVISRLLWQVCCATVYPVIHQPNLAWLSRGWKWAKMAFWPPLNGRLTSEDLAVAYGIHLRPQPTNIRVVPKQNFQSIFYVPETELHCQHLGASSFVEVRTSNVAERWEPESPHVPPPSFRVPVAVLVTGETAVYKFLSARSPKNRSDRCVMAA